MQFLTNSDIIPLFENVTKALLPAAKSHCINLNFSTIIEQFIIRYNALEIINDFTKLLSNIIVYSPEGSQIDICVKAELKADAFLKVGILSASANLSSISEITSSLRSKCLISNPNSNSTLFEIFIKDIPEISWKGPKVHKINHYGIPPYYSEIRKRLKSHFSSIQSMEDAAIKKSHAHGVFIQKINELLLQNLDQENFKISTICHDLGLSRTQLYRKLKSLINMSPAKYVLYFRLQKAKELLQDTNLNVGEVANKTGFASHSHFTRKFNAQFGISPSQMKNEKAIEL